MTHDLQEPQFQSLNKFKNKYKYNLKFHYDTTILTPQKSNYFSGNGNGIGFCHGTVTVTLTEYEENGIVPKIDDDGSVM